MKTPKEKAEELVEKYSPMMYCYMGSGMLSNDYDEKIVKENAIECAKIAVDELISDTDASSPFESERLIYWQELKNELNKMS